MKINEIFYSIQGEGSWTGLPNIFIRTTGCNLRCTYCDTQYAYEAGTEMTIASILSQIKSYPCTHICLTGGEPLLQHDAPELLAALSKKHYKTSIETNGSIPIKPFIKKQSIMVSLDIKCPCSQMHTKMNLDNIVLLRSQDQLKFVIKTRVDYEYAKIIITKYKPKCTIFFQPVWGTNPINLGQWILEDGLSAHLGIQLHKILFGETKGR